MVRHARQTVHHHVDVPPLAETITAWLAHDEVEAGVEAFEVGSRTGRLALWGDARGVERTDGEGYLSARVSSEGRRHGRAERLAAHKLCIGRQHQVLLRSGVSPMRHRLGDPIDYAPISMRSGQSHSLAPTEEGYSPRLKMKRASMT